jgi:predicted transcriptional regulator
MKITEIDALTETKFDQYQNTTITNDEDAVKWAKGYGVKEVYKYIRPNGILWIVRANGKTEKNEA